MRELKAQWMINGPGGYTVRHLTVKIPTAYEALLVLSFFVLLAEVWYLWKR